MSKWIEPEPENAGPELIREAQAITGALLWAVTRTRPDLAFTVSKMSGPSSRMGDAGSAVRKYSHGPRLGV